MENRTKPIFDTVSQIQSRPGFPKGERLSLPFDGISTSSLSQPVSSSKAQPEPSCYTPLPLPGRESLALALPGGLREGK